MSLKGGAQDRNERAQDMHAENGKSTHGRLSERTQPRSIENSSYVDSDDDGFYRRQGKRQNYGRRDDDDIDNSRESNRQDNLERRDGGPSPSNGYHHRRPSSPYRRSQPHREYRTDSPSSRPIDDRFSPLEQRWNSPPSRRRDHNRPPHDDRRPNRRYSPPDKHRGKSDSPSRRYEDPWDTTSNNRNDRRRDRPRYRDRPFSNRRARDSPSDTSGDSLDRSPSRRNSRNRSPLQDKINRRNTTDSPINRYEDQWDTANKNVFSPKDKPQDKPQDKPRDKGRQDSPPNKTRKVENVIAKTGEPQYSGQHSHKKGNLERLDRENKQPNVELGQESDRSGSRNNHVDVSFRGDGDTHQSQVSTDHPAGGGQDEAKLVYGQDENEERGNWSGKFDFILSMLGYAVGLGNVWRFPYLCYRNGGGAFLFPFLFMMVTIGLPVFYLEAALGQFTSCGAMTCWHFAPLFKGLGIAMVAVSGLTSIYYNIIIGWSLHYMFSSFTSDLPFASCQNKWNTENCKLKLPVMACEGDAKASDGRCLDANGKESGLWNKTLFTEVTGRTLQSPSQEYWERFVLNFSDGIEHYGQPKWDLVLCLLLAWIICFLCLIKGIKTTGKVVYFTALFPYVVLVILWFRGVTLENADIGIKYFITPNFERLADASVWKDAANQVFFSMSIAGGGLITLSSYNRFHNNILRDSIIVAVGDAGTCILGGFVIFSYLGYMAGQLQVDIEDVAADGAGLAFVVYPEAVSNLPPPTLWAILFFVMLLTLGLDSQFAMVETVLTGTLDQYPKCRSRKTLVILVICILFFIFGLPLTCPGGMYLLQLMDNYVGGMTLIIIGFIEIIAVVFIYGVNRFCQDIHIMTGSSRFLFWKVAWRVLSPLVIAFIFIFMFVDYKPSMYDKYTYPTWADVIGWIMTIMCVLAIPVVMVFKIYREHEGKTIWQKLRLLCLPTVYWGPALKKHRALVSYVDGFQVDPYKGLETNNCFVNYAFDKTPETSTKSESQVSLGVSRISIISATSKCTSATAKSEMTYESNV